MASTVTSVQAHVGVNCAMHANVVPRCGKAAQNRTRPANVRDSVEAHMPTCARSSNIAHKVMLLRRKAAEQMRTPISYGKPMTGSGRSTPPSSWTPAAACKPSISTPPRGASATHGQSMEMPHHRTSPAIRRNSRVARTIRSRTVSAMASVRPLGFREVVGSHLLARADHGKENNHVGRSVPGVA